MTPPQNVIFQPLTQFKTKFCILAFYSCIKDSKKKILIILKIKYSTEDNAIASVLDNYSQKLKIQCCKPFYETLVLRNEIVNGEV